MTTRLIRETNRLQMALASSMILYLVHVLIRNGGHSEQLPCSVIIYRNELHAQIIQVFSIFLIYVIYIANNNFSELFVFKFLL